VNDLPARVAPRHNMVDGTLEFDPPTSWHIASGTPRIAVVNQEPKLILTPDRNVMPLSSN
jgi:hypothetical protein